MARPTLLEWIRRGQLRAGRGKSGKWKIRWHAIKRAAENPHVAAVMARARRRMREHTEKDLARHIQSHDSITIQTDVAGTWDTHTNATTRNHSV